MDSHPVERAVCSTPYFLFFVFFFFFCDFIFEIWCADRF